MHRKASIILKRFENNIKNKKLSESYYSILDYFLDFIENDPITRSTNFDDTRDWFSVYNYHFEKLVKLNLSFSIDDLFMFTTNIEPLLFGSIRRYGLQGTDEEYIQAFSKNNYHTSPSIKTGIFLTILVNLLNSENVVLFIHKIHFIIPLLLFYHNKKNVIIIGDSTGEGCGYQNEGNITIFGNVVGNLGTENMGNIVVYGNIIGPVGENMSSGNINVWGNYILPIDGYININNPKKKEIKVGLPPLYLTDEVIIKGGSLYLNGTKII